MIPFKLSNLPLLLWLFLFCGRLLLSLLPSSFCFFLSTLQSHSSYLSSSSLPFSFFYSISIVAFLSFLLFLTLTFFAFFFFFIFNYLLYSLTAPYLISSPHTPLYDPTPQRDQLDVMYNSDMGDMFDISEARVALQAKRIELMAECDANAKLQRR